MPMCDGSDGKAENSGLKGPWFNSPLRQENFSCFQLVALEPMRSAPKYLNIAANTRDNNSHGNGEEGTLFP